MKKLSILSAAFIFSSFIFSCSTPENNISQTVVSTENTNVADPKSGDEESEAKSEPKTAICKSEEKMDGTFPTITKNCKYGNIQSRTVGYPDMKGRYSYSYELFLNGKKVKNSEIFNDKMPELLSKLNKKILKEYSVYYNSEDGKDCFMDMPQNPKFKMDDLNIDFDDKNIIFNASFGLPEICLAFNGSIVSIPLEKIETYLKK